MDNRPKKEPSSRPRVSVLMATHNGEKHIRSSIDCILNQTYRELEFIIIDDASTDNTGVIVEDYARADQRITLVTNSENLGLARSLNKALDLARGEYITRQDDDDLSEVDRIEKQLEYLKGHQEIDLLGSAWRFIDEKDRPIGEVHPPLSDTAIRWETLFHNSFCHPAVLLRTEWIRRHGLRYNPEMSYTEDYDLWSRILEVGKAANMPEMFVAVRKHGANVTGRQPRVKFDQATRISERNISRLAPRLELSFEQIGRLRAYYHGQSAGAGVGEFALALNYLRLQDALGREPVVDRAELRGIRRRWIRRTIAAIPTQAAGAFLKSGLALAMVRREPVVTLKAIQRRLIAKIQKTGATEEPS